MDEILVFFPSKTRIKPTTRARPIRRSTRAQSMEENNGFNYTYIHTTRRRTTFEIEARTGFFYILHFVMFMWIMSLHIVCRLISVLLFLVLIKVIYFVTLCIKSGMEEAKKSRFCSSYKKKIVLCLHAFLLT